MFIGIDIGGTHTRVALGEKGKIEDKKDFPTGEFDQTIEEINRAISKFKNTQIKAIGVSVASPYNYKTNTLFHPPNLPKSWDGKNIADIFTKKFGINTFAGNDASVIALGEYRYGAGQGKDPMLYYTVSTGIGSGLIVNGQIYKGSFNPEAGHQILNLTAPAHPGAPTSDLESLSSGSAIKRLYNKEPVELENKPEWFKVINWLAIGLTNSILHFSPEIVVVGGGMTKHKDIFFVPLRKAVEEYLVEVPKVSIVPASLGQDNSIIGPLTLAEESVKNSQ